MSLFEIMPGAPTIYSENFTIRSYHVDIHRKLTLPKLCSFFQDIAGNHTVACGVGWEVLQRENIFWVLSRLKVEIKKYPEWQQTITIRSWSNGLTGIMAVRHFQVLSSDGEELIRAISMWLTVDTATRRIVRPNDLMTDFPLNNERLFESNPDKISALNNPVQFEPIPVSFTETDMNMHMNNVSYIDRIINSYDFDFLMNHQISEFEINFLKEAVPGDRIKVQQQKVNDNEFLNNMVSDGDERIEMVRTWMKYDQLNK